MVTARALTIAGSDPSGGAGIQADLKTFHRFSAYGMSALTLLTVQNTLGVTRVDILEPAFVRAQIDACIADIGVDAAKTGALGSAAVIRAVAQAELKVPLVVDPVMVSKHGAPLLAADAAKALKDELLPRAYLLMPNLPEAEVLLGSPITDMEAAAKALHTLGPRAVLLKGGHAAGDANDVLYDGQTLTWLKAPRVDTPHTHGTGCTYSAAITALLARGTPLLDAAQQAKAFITRAIVDAPALGQGQGPVNHWV